MDGDVVGGLAAGIANLQHELGRLSNLDFAWGKLLNDERWLLRTFQCFLAGFPAGHGWRTDRISRRTGQRAGRWRQRANVVVRGNAGGWSYGVSVLAAIEIAPCGSRWVGRSRRCWLSNGLLNVAG